MLKNNEEHHVHHHGDEEENIKASVLRLALGMIVAFTGIYFENKLGGNALASLLVILGYCILVYRTAKSAILELIHEHEIDETFLMTVSSIGAYLIGEHLEGLMVIILYEIGEILEDKAVDKRQRERWDAPATISALHHAHTQHFPRRLQPPCHTPPDRHLNLYDSARLKHFPPSDCNPPLQCQSQANKNLSTDNPVYLHQ